MCVDYTFNGNHPPLLATVGNENKITFIGQMSKTFEISLSIYVMKSGHIKDLLHLLTYHIVYNSFYIYTSTEAWADFS